jgi:hypothetical protein
MGGHGDLARITGVSVEFCDSASSWARGRDKGTNGIHIPEDWTRALLSSMNGPQDPRAADFCRPSGRPFLP